MFIKEEDISSEGSYTTSVVTDIQTEDMFSEVEDVSLKLMPVLSLTFCMCRKSIFYLPGEIGFFK